jgi:hypothetical protein
MKGYWEYSLDCVVHMIFCHYGMSCVIFATASGFFAACGLPCIVFIPPMNLLLVFISLAI